MKLNFFPNEPTHDWDISFLWCWDNVQNLKTLLFIDQYGSYRKNVINNIIYFLILQWYLKIWSKFALWLWWYKIDAKNMLILYYTDLFKNYGKYHKKFISEIVLFYNYEWAKRMKFLLAVIYGSPRRHSYSCNTFKKNRKNVNKFFMKFF